MSVKRTSSLIVGAAIVLLMGMPTVAFAQPSTVESAGLARTAANVGAVRVDVLDPSLASAPQVALVGELRIVVADPPAVAIGAAATPASELTSYSVVKADGSSVPVSGELPASAKSGDLFTGSVAVPQTVIDSLSDSHAETVKNSAGATPVAAASAATTSVLETAAAQSASLPIASGSVAPAPAAAQAAATAAVHQVQIVVVRPAGSANLPASYTDAAIKTIVARATGFWTGLSNSLITSWSAAASVVTYTSAVACSSNPDARWDEAARALNYPNADAYLADGGAVVRHLLVVIPPSCTSVSGIGIGTVGANLNSGGLSQIVLGGNVDRQVSTHELGHNLSLGHSNVDKCSSASSCTTDEYADFYDVMGVSFQGGDEYQPTLNSRSRIGLGFTTVATANHFELASGVANGSRTYTIGKLDGGTTPTIIEAVDPLTSLTYYIEYRGGEGGNAIYTKLGAAPQSGSGMGSQVIYQPGVRLLRTDSATGGNGIAGSSAVTTYDTALGGYRPYAIAGKPLANPSGSV